jgi:hypothetical protein
MGESTIPLKPMKPTDFESSTIQNRGLFRQIDRQVEKASLPRPDYWALYDYVDSILELILNMLAQDADDEAGGGTEKLARMILLMQQMLGSEAQDPLAEYGGLTPEAALAKEIGAISPTRRLFIFLCVAKRMATDMRTVKNYVSHGVLNPHLDVIAWLDAQFRQACSELTKSEWESFDYPLLSKIADAVRHVAQFGFMCRIKLSSFYLGFWGRMAPNSELFTAELKVAAESVDASTSIADRKTAVTMIRYLYLLSDADYVRETLEKALAKKKNVDDAIVKALGVLEILFELERFLQARDGLTQLLEHMRHVQASHQTIHKFCSLWMQLAIHRPELESECLAALRVNRDKIPAVYDDYLLEHQHDKEWVAYQLTNDYFAIEYISKKDLRIVEKRNMQYLLPLYFQSAEKYVEMKNRQSYKHAVRLLKKIAAYYKKTKRQDRFEVYLQGFMKRHSRLRALHEEMRKGRLIS